jgi:hypothetical protein
MGTKRLPLINYDVVRELCQECSNERFQFVPTGAPFSAGTCSVCGTQAKLADMSDTGVWRLLTTADGEVVVAPVN